MLESAQSKLPGFFNKNAARRRNGKEKLRGVRNTSMESRVCTPLQAASSEALSRQRGPVGYEHWVRRIVLRAYTSVYRHVKDAEIFTDEIVRWPGAASE